MTRVASLLKDRGGLASLLPGKVLLPAQDGWDKARRPWQLHVEQRPAAVVFPELASDVAIVVRFAAERGLRVTAQGTGHSASALGRLEDVILIKTERMRRVVIDGGARVARVEAGVRTAELAGPAAHGPKQVRLVLSIGAHYPAVCGDQLDRSDTVRCETEAAT